MLQAIRDKAQGWIAWVIVILISIPFALWGIQEYLGVGSEPEVAVVEGEVLTQRMLDQRTRDFRDNIRQSLGDAYSADMFDDARLKPQVLDAMIEELVLAKTAERLNLRTSDEQARQFIASVPAFQRDGAFDQLAYDSLVRNRGMTRAGFEQRVRQDLILDQLREAVTESAFVTDTQLARQVGLANQKRHIAYLQIPADQFSDQVEVSAEGLRAFYDANPQRYRTPERLRLDYMILDTSTLGSMVEVSDQALRNYFDDHRSEFLGNEERNLRHILIAVPPGAEEAVIDAARIETETLLTRITDGADFADLARAHSADPGSAGAGGDLGWVERGAMVAAFEEAAFALDEGAVSAPVRTEFGYHLIQATAIRGGSDAGFEDVRDQVEQAYRRHESEALYFEYAERLAESVYENPDSLMPAAELLGLEVRSTDWVTRSGGLPDEINSPRLLNIAFSDDVLEARHNSEPVELAQQRAVVVRVSDYEPAGLIAFDAHLEQIERDMRAEVTSKEAERMGTELLAELRQSDTGLADIAARHGWTLEEPGAVPRDHADLPRPILREAFALPPPDGRPAFGGSLDVHGNFLLVEVSSVLSASLDALDDADQQLQRQQIVRGMGNAQMSALTEDLRQRSKIKTQAIATPTL